MARYKKRRSLQPGLPGLFDDFDDVLLPGASDFTVQRAADDGEPDGANAVGDKKAENESILAPMEDVPAIDRLKFISFGSGSSGNCAFVGDEESGLLIDAGVDMATVTAELSRNGIDMRVVKGIVLTHDHSDHVRFVYAIVRKYKHLRVYCTPRTLNGLLRRHAISNRIKDYHQPIYKEHPFKIDNFTLVAFEVMHDGTDNAGFHISNGGHSLVVATDMGCISERADHYMRMANYLMIESNYDSEMLANGSYPEYLKARIRSDNGHLDNSVTADYLSKIYTPALKRVFLCHLSKDNNTKELALKASGEALRKAGIAEVGDGSESAASRQAAIQLMALPRFESTGLISLRLK